MLTSNSFTVKDIPLLVSMINTANSRLQLLNSLPSVKGYSAEEYIASLIGGILTDYSDEVDVTLKTDSRKKISVEVKFSSISYPSKVTLTTTRWHWSAPLGYKDYGKVYDYLILVGEDAAGERHLFLVPYADVPSIMSSGSATGANLQANTNKHKAKLRGALIWEKYITSEALTTFFANLAKDSDILLVRNSQKKRH